MKKEEKKYLRLVAVMISIVIIIAFSVHLFLNNSWESKSIEGELTGYSHKSYRWDFIFYSPPEVTLVFGENEIDFELPLDNFVNWTPHFNGIWIQEFKNNDVIVSYSENGYGHKIITDLKLKPLT